jgi:hypothetical protein
VLLAIADPALHFVLGFGQISVLALAAVTLAFAALRRNRRFAAGLAIGALFYKPQLGIVAAILFPLAGEWEIVLGAIVSIALQLSAAALFWGPHVLVDYGQSLILLLPRVPLEFEAFAAHQHSWRAFFDVLRLPPSIAFSAYLAASADTIGLTIYCWGTRGPLALRYALFLLATVLVDPHLYTYDLIVLLPALLLVWNWCLEQADIAASREPSKAETRSPMTRRSLNAFEWLLYACYFAPLSGMFADFVRIQLSVLVLAVTGLVLARFLRQTAPAVQARASSRGVAFRTPAV